MREEKPGISELADFEEFFRFYHPRLKNYAYYFLKDEAEAEDLVQDVFYQFWINRKSLKKDKNKTSYIFTLLKNRCFNILKRRIVQEKYILNQTYFESEELYQLSFDSKGEFISMEELLHRELSRIISQMPEKSRHAFTLKWIEGKKIREIADEMNISTTMVDKYLAKGLAYVKENLDPDLFMLFLFFSKS